MPGGLLAKALSGAMHDMSDFKRLSVSAHLVDARGKACPMPIIELAKALRAHDEVELWADDPAAEGDVEAFSSSTGHRILASSQRGGQPFQVLVRHRKRGTSGQR